MGWWVHVCSLFSCVVLSIPVFGAQYGDDTYKLLSHRVEMLRLELANHEAEIQTLNEKVLTQQEIIEALRGELSKALGDKKAQKQVDALASAQQGAMKGVSGDIDKLRNHADASASKIRDHSKRLEELEAATKGQVKNLHEMQVAMQAVLEALRSEGGEPLDGTVTYSVKSGDSLGTIAKKYHTKIREIKALNKLKNDTIMIGQKLKIPDQMTAQKHE